MENRAPFQRPRYTQGYFPIGADGYNNHLYRVGGYTVNSIYQCPCQNCVGFPTQMNCQYGNPCSKKVCAIKPSFIKYNL